MFDWASITNHRPPATNLYVHFPFCRGKCSYCALHSRAGISSAARESYVKGLLESLSVFGDSGDAGPARNQQPATSNQPPATNLLSTIYFGGGSPALCDLTPLAPAIVPLIGPDTEFTVELHPLDVTREKLHELKFLGVSRISMGVQSLDDDILRHMRRGYDFYTAERAFALIKEHFDNAGIDLIVGYPGETSALTPRHARLAKWGLKHCSVYSLILEEKSILGHLLSKSGACPHGQTGTVPIANGDCPQLPDDETVMNRISIISRFMEDIGLERYEISNYAAPGYECRHNLAVWRGEDYIGLGDGAHGRMGLTRTQNWLGPQTGQNSHSSDKKSKILRGLSPENGGLSPRIETVSREKDTVERKIFALRTRFGLDIADETWGQSPTAWGQTLDGFVEDGLLTRTGTVYRLTERGTEVCDSILAELV